jgi:hypothetical protein
MATLEDLYQVRWNAVNKDVPYNPEAGLLKYWKAHPEIGSPLSPEVVLDDGSTAQVFANGIVIWRDGGPEPVTPPEE